MTTTPPAPGGRARWGDAVGDPGSVWDDLVGQHRVVEALRAAAGGHGMSHAWLFTGPPGSGRSNAAVAFAAALQCERGQGPEAGCGECHECHTVLAGSHADVTMVRTEKLSIGVDEVRDLVRRSALAPVGRRWQIMIVEDADRLTEQACNALLKAIEEPTARTVWMLCAPTVEDVLPTIRSRCRLVTLTTPTTEDVAAFLVRNDGVPESLASYAARASQGHIGRARALARDEGTRNRRREVVSYPAKLTSLGACMTAAANLAEVTKEEADQITSDLDAREKADLDTAYGVVERGRRPREYAPALSALEKRPEDPRQAAPPRHGRPRADGPGLGLPRRDRARHRRRRDAGQRGDPRRRRAGRPHLDPGAEPAADRGDLRRTRADAGVQCPRGPGAGVDDGRAQGSRPGAADEGVATDRRTRRGRAAGGRRARGRPRASTQDDDDPPTSRRATRRPTLAPTPTPEPGATEPPDGGPRRRSTPRS